MNHVANFISCIKVGVKCSKTQVAYSGGPKFLINLAKTIYSEGLIVRYVVSQNDVLSIKMFLKPGLIKNIKIISTPGRRVYAPVRGLKSSFFKNPRKIYFISSSAHGIVSINKALEKNTGGEVLCFIEV
jgi:ribosomal protein S8